MRKIKVGLAGLGRLGMEHARNVAFNIPNAELTAVCSVVKEERDRVMREWGVPFGYSDFEEMVQNRDLEAAVIVSPSPLHVQHLTAALEAGLHVFVDKPLGVSAEECKAAEKAVEARGDRVFMVGFMRRYDPSYAYAKKLIEEGRIGRPYLAKFASLDPEDCIEGALRFAPTSGGIFLDMAVHDIDLARWFLGGEITEVYAMGGAFVHSEFAGFGDSDNACAMMRFDNNAMALLHAGRDAAHGYHVETEIIGEKGSLRIGTEPLKNLCAIFDNNGVVRECAGSFQERFAEAYLLEMKEFIDCILENRRPGITVYDGTRNTEAAFAATRSLRENRIVKL